MKLGVLTVVILAMGHLFIDLPGVVPEATDFRFRMFSLA